MNVIYGKKQAEELAERFIVLPLDKIQPHDIDGIIEAYCIIAADKVPLPELPQIEKMKVMHAAMMDEYYKQNWIFCEEALGHLKGKWNGQVDSFYITLQERVEQLKTTELPDDWNGVFTQAD